jgi:outer membrane lipoprotein-sorting protein
MIGLGLCLWLVPTPASALTAREIMEKVDAREDGDNMTADLEMVLIDKSGHKRIRKIHSFSKDKGKDTQRLMFFLEPADVKDTGFLTYDYYEGFKDDDQWLYLPELKKTKRIASSDKSSSFMGSDFSYADMTRRVLDEWKYKILKEDQVRGKKVWLIEAVPADKAVEDRYGYTKSVVFVRQDIFFVVRGVSWVKEGRKLKYLDVRELEQIDGIWVGTRLHMRTVKNKRTLHETELNFSAIKFNQDLKDDLFTIRRLEKGM